MKPSEKTQNKRVIIEKKQLVFNDRFKIEEAYLKYEKFNGDLSPTMRRLNFERGDAAAIMVYNTDTQTVILTDQFRYPTYGKGDGWLIEIAAGVLDKDEKPEDTIKREMIEEIGYKVNQLVPLYTFFTTPGGSSERIFLYYAEVTNADNVSDGGGIESDGEDIRIVEYTLAELWNALDTGTLQDAKTLIAALWLRNNLNKLNAK
ncbi:MAG: NUDIX domain-containing protein [Candidatus Omnitrophota bacterium]